MRVRRLRASGLIIATAGFVVLAAACGGSQRNDAAPLGSTGAVAFSGCMRANGVPNWPDPDAGGHIPKVSLQQLGVSSSRVASAQGACRHLLPNGGQPPSQAQVQQVKAEGLQFAQCVRAHGVPSFPDPGGDGRIPDPATVGIDQGSPRFQAANRACGRYRPPYMPSNADYEAWVRTHS